MPHSSAEYIYIYIWIQVMLLTKKINEEYHETQSTLLLKLIKIVNSLKRQYGCISGFLWFHGNSFVCFYLILQSIESGTSNLVVGIEKHYFLKCLKSRFEIFHLLISISKVVPGCDITRLKFYSIFKLCNSLVYFPIKNISYSQCIVNLLIKSKPLLWKICNHSKKRKGFILVQDLDHLHPIFQ